MKPAKKIARTKKVVPTEPDPRWPSLSAKDQAAIDLCILCYQADVPASFVESLCALVKAFAHPKAVAR